MTKHVGHQTAAAGAEAFKFDVAAVYLKFNDADLREIYDQIIRGSSLRILPKSGIIL